jgi:hypothetical protein
MAWRWAGVAADSRCSPEIRLLPLLPPQPPLPPVVLPLLLVL